MFLGKLRETVLQNPFGQHLGSSQIAAALQLQQQALLYVAGSHPGRFERLYHTESLLQFRYVYLLAVIECDVVGNGLQVEPQVTVVVYVAYDVTGYFELFLRHFTVRELFRQVLVHAHSLEQHHLPGLVVARIVIDIGFIGGRFGLLEVLFHRHLFRHAVVLGALFGGLLFLFEYRVLLNLLFDALFQLQGRQFEQLYHLYLLRR